MIRRRGSGQALVEFALIIPLLLLLIVGSIEVSRLAGGLLLLRHAAFAADRAAAVGTDDPGVRALTAQQVASVVVGAQQATESYQTDPVSGGLVYVVHYGDGSDGQWVELWLAPPAAQRHLGQTVRAELRWYYRPLFLGWILKGPMTLVTACEGRVEQGS